MNHIALALALYFGVNFVCALVLHVHAEHQAHLRLRAMDVLVHFVLLTAFGLPALLFITAEALFGGDGRAKLPKKTRVSPAGARAA